MGHSSPTRSHGFVQCKAICAAHHTKLPPTSLGVAPWCAARRMALLASIAVMAFFACQQFLSVAGQLAQPLVHDPRSPIPRSAQHPTGSSFLQGPNSPSCRSLGTKPTSPPAGGSGQLTAQRILVTGAAGFIGLHAAKALSQQLDSQGAPQYAVVGLDSFTDLPGFGSGLKRDRADMLWRCCKVHVVRGDIRNTSLLQQLFSCFNFTQVLHLAGRAGVRQSVQQPGEYVSANVMGSVELLQVMAQQPLRPQLVYASSSSVYGSASSSRHAAAAAGSLPTSTTGRERRPDTAAAPSAVIHHHQQQQGQQQPLPVMPSKETDTFQPLSVYAASKVALEQLVGVYTSQYAMTAIGLRFFTVFGPWGRPDMAVMGLAHSLLHKHPINITCFINTPNPQRGSPWAPQALATQQQQEAAAAKHSQTETTAAAAAMQVGQLRWRQQPLPAPALAAASPGGLSELGRGQHSSRSSWPCSSPATEQQQQRYGVPPSCYPACRDFTYIDDVVQGILGACRTAAATTALGQPSASHHVYNIGRGRPQSVLSVLQTLEGLLGMKPCFTVRFNRVSAGTSPDAEVTWADTSAAGADLGFSPRNDLRQGLQAFVEWFAQYYGSHLSTA